MELHIKLATLTALVNEAGKHTGSPLLP